MQNIIKIFCLSFLVLFVSGCTTYYEDVPVGTDRAAITFKNAHPRSKLHYVLVRTAQETESCGAALLPKGEFEFRRPVKDQTTFFIPAREEFRMYLYWHTITGVVTSSCDAYMKFTPKNNGVYNVNLLVDYLSGRCAAGLTREEAGEFVPVELDEYTFCN